MTINEPISTKVMLVTQCLYDSYIRVHEKKWYCCWY